QYFPLDGELIRACDHFAAYMEAYLSISHGVKSHYLEEGYQQLFRQYKNKIIADFNVCQWFNYFCL
ncbi:MAG: HAD family hydrolase, partial [Firmicutes bacterium]|nr:HAD family hydrolase [Bacillota bacterium]